MTKTKSNQKQSGKLPLKGFYDVIDRVDRAVNPARQTLRLRSKPHSAPARAQTGAQQVAQPIVQTATQAVRNSEVQSIAKDVRRLKGEVLKTAGLKTSQSVPVAFGNTMTTREPKIVEGKANGKRSLRIAHREYITDFTGSIDFNTISFECGAGNSDTFPWLSEMAQEFQFYEMKSLRFILNTSAATSEGGVLMAAFICDPVDRIPNNKAIMLNYVGAKRAVAWQGLTCDCPVSALRQVKLRNIGRGFQLNALNTGGLLETDLSNDPRFADPARFVLATAGYPADDIVVGEIWVEYDVEFSAPRPAQLNVKSCEVNCLAATMAADGNLNAFFGTLDTSTNPLSTLSWSAPPGNLQVQSHGGNRFYINQMGQFLVDIYVYATGYTAGSFTEVPPTDTANGYIILRQAQGGAIGTSKRSPKVAAKLLVTIVDTHAPLLLSGTLDMTGAITRIDLLCANVAEDSVYIGSI